MLRAATRCRDTGARMCAKLSQTCYYVYLDASTVDMPAAAQSSPHTGTSYR